VEVKFYSHVYDIFVGGDGPGQSAALTPQAMFVWGQNDRAQLGLGPLVEECVLTPTEQPFPISISKVSFGDTQTIILTSMIHVIYFYLYFQRIIRSIAAVQQILMINFIHLKSFLFSLINQSLMPN
jgi:hypothetical protein